MPGPLIVGAFVFIPWTIWATWQQSAGGPPQWSHVMANCAGTGLVAAGLFLPASARLEVVNGFVLRIVSIWTVIELGRAQIAGFDAKKGLGVLTVDGTRFGSSAYGRSLGGEILGYRRATRAAERCTKWLAADAVAGADEQLPAPRRLRLAFWPLVLAWPVSYCAFGSVAFAIYH